MDFISQYVLANAGTEVPIKFTRWCAISLLSTVMGRKVLIDAEHFILTPWLYFGLIGNIGSGKTTAKNQARNMLVKAIPDYPTGVSITSREDIIRYMSSDKCERFYVDETGNPVSWRPIANYVNELSNFLSFAPGPMIEFLTDIFDEGSFISRTIKRGEEKIDNPFVALLACTPPETMMKYLRMEVFGGGFLRRFLMIYDTTEVEPITFPKKPPEAIAAEEWCIAHLQKLWTLAGHFRFDSEETREFLIDWNKNKVIPRDRLLVGYYAKKVNIVQKIAMCVAGSEEHPKLILTRRHLELAIALLDANEDNFPLLTMAVGRNELAVPQARLLQIIVNRGGMMPEKEWHRIANLEMYEMEYSSMKRFLKETDQLVEIPIPNKSGTGFTMMVLTREKHIELLRNGEIGPKA